MIASDWRRLADELSAQFDVTTAVLAVAGQPLELLRPRDADALLDEMLFEEDERIPYWADIWPSARVLAERLAQHDGRGKRLLELGCGVGLCAAAASRAGFDVTATDYYHEALSFTQVNVRRNGLPAPHTRLVDWRRYPDDDAMRGFDLVVAADVLYEKPYAALVAAALARSLAPGGLGLVADPGRRHAQQFVAACREQALWVAPLESIPFAEGTTAATIHLYTVAREADRLPGSERR